SDHELVISRCSMNIAPHHYPWHRDGAPGQSGRGEPIAQIPEDGETPMTTETTTMYDTVKEAFAPVTEAFKNFQNMEVPEAARDFVRRAANNAKERAADVYAGSEKVTTAIETAVADSITEVAKISRNIQQAVYEDAEAFFTGLDKLASAKTINEAVQIQSD